MPDQPVHLVRSIHRATHRIGLYLGGLKPVALSQGEAHVLARLATSSPATIAELHADLAHRRSTLTSILDRLVARGLVSRAPGVDDRRTFVVAMTAAGRVVAAAVQRHVIALERAVGRRVPPRDIRACVRVLAAVEEQARAAARATPARR
jgi:DNA-binding MarR family transcriptional regulator